MPKGRRENVKKKGRSHCRRGRGGHADHKKKEKKTKKGHDAPEEGGRTDLYAEGASTRHHNTPGVRPRRGIPFYVTVVLTAGPDRATLKKRRKESGKEKSLVKQKNGEKRRSLRWEIKKKESGKSLHLLGSPRGARETVVGTGSI